MGYEVTSADFSPRQCPARSLCQCPSGGSFFFVSCPPPPQVETLSSGIPLLVARLGDRRRLERSWMGWRGWISDQRVRGVEAQLEEQGKLKEELEYLHMLLEEQQLKQQIEAQQSLDHQRLALMPSEGGGLDLLADGGGLALSRRTTATWVADGGWL